MNDLLNFINEKMGMVLMFDCDVHCYIIFGDYEFSTEEFDFVFLSRKQKMGRKGI